MVTLSAIIQAPVQALLRPSMWIPIYHRLHSQKETWRTDATKTEFITFLLSAIQTIMSQDGNTEWFDIHQINVDQTFVRIFAFTRVEWLDVIEISYIAEGRYEVVSFSSGLFPLIIPFACILNLVLFYFPFFDLKANQKRLERIRQIMNIPVSLL